MFKVEINCYLLQESLQLLMGGGGPVLLSLDVGEYEVHINNAYNDTKAVI